MVIAILSVWKDLYDKSKTGTHKFSWRILVFIPVTILFVYVNFYKPKKVISQYFVELLD